MSKIRIVALGGLDESGKNLYCIEIDDKIIVVNAGLKFPDENQYGIEYIVPDFQLSSGKQGPYPGCCTDSCS